MTQNGSLDEPNQLGPPWSSEFVGAAPAPVRLTHAAPPAAAIAAHRARVELALCQDTRQFDEFFAHATEGILRMGPTGIVLWANRAECRLLECAADELIGHSIGEFHVDRDQVAEMLRKLHQGESVENVAATLRSKGGSIKHVLITANASFEGGKFVDARCFTCAVTRRGESNRALRDADRHKDEFLAILAHELRNPLAPIVNAVEVLEAKLCDERTAAEAVSIIKRQVGQLARLIDDLLDVSRIARDQVELRKQPVELSAIVNRALETSRPLIEAAGHELIVEMPAESLVVDADPGRLAQVFANLVSNSAKYTRPGGQIRVQVEHTVREVVVRVRDNGIGISREALAHVFDMFQQVDRSLERSQGGLGIGLTLARRLAELHGGRIDAHSEGPGKGSEFVVRLPRAREAARPAALLPAPHVTPAAKRRVLVVDDDHDSGNTLSTLLRMKGHDVRTARDGLEALAFVEQFAPDVILMDVGMPRLNGYDAARQIRLMPGGRDVVIVAITGWGQDEDVRRCVEAGFSAHMLKPIDFAGLDELLAHPRARNS